MTSAQGFYQSTLSVESPIGEHGCRMEPGRRTQGPTTLQLPTGTVLK